jgi:hypothetical protein
VVQVVGSSRSGMRDEEVGGGGGPPKSAAAAYLSRHAVALAEPLRRVAATA